jgi:light-regulated signal transduction histidine kinase (bacteriophytochrome)
VLSTPAFGQADLSNCEREQIHLAGSIQPHGALLVFSEPDLLVVQTSANAAAFLKLRGDPIGWSIEDLGGNLADRLRGLLRDPLHDVPASLTCSLGGSAGEFDAVIHRPAGGGLVVELEISAPAIGLSQKLDRALQMIIACATLRSLCDETARIFRQITGYDRVMVYRFDDDGHGEVFSEQVSPGLEPYLGNRYPASDIPQIARRLYVRNRVRVLSDVDYAPVPLTPRLSPLTGEDLDMSLCCLRSMSPIHLQYLKNMGVGATLVASLVVGGKLWGLVACHHYVPRTVPFEIRAASDLLAEAVSTRIAALESFIQSQAELSVRRLEQRMIEAIHREGDWRVPLFDSSQALLQPVGATGAALLFDGQILTAGEVPGTPQLREIGRWLDRRSAGPLIATVSLGLDEPAFAPLIPVASGLLATRVSSEPGEYLIWFRPERVRTITWAGDPFKPVAIGDNPMDLSPRRSFSRWHQLMEGNAEPWAAADLTAARLIGSTISDVVLQFRSVLMLIAQDQLDKVRRQVRLSEQPVIIVDTEGRILLANEAFHRLLPACHAPLEVAEDLLPLFAGSGEIRQRLRDLLDHRRTWRGEVRLESETGILPLLVRADPVYASPDRVLGFVLLFTDTSEQREAAAARLRFQEGIAERRRMVAGRRGSKADVVFQTLMSALVENAQLAAMEITDRADGADMRDMLESVRLSLARMEEMLGHLAGHIDRPPKA